jgi:hypothetical protein
VCVGGGRRCDFEFTADNIQLLFIQEEKRKKNEIKSLLAFCLGCDSVKHRRSRRTQAEVYICEKEKKKDDESQP